MPEHASAPRDGTPRILVVTPTYNEAGSLADTVAAILSATPEAHVLVVDDASPDGTGAIADGLAAAEPRVSVLHRAGKQGLGRAYVAGFRVALDRGYDVIVEMDADGSHPASALPALVAALADDPAVGLAIGSRYVPGGGLADWAAGRRLLSRAGNAYARFMLRLGVRDVTAGYRAYRAEVLRGLPLDEIDSRGYCFQIDMTLRTLDAGWRIVERPIEFRERTAGRSKMSKAIVAEAMLRVTVWSFARLLRRRTPVSRPMPGANATR
ncbi:polyprenol monophosphomannose synthase [Pseudolysinimonas yzui]|uniref:Dolichol-phosphate mannosyltransferase n=1 Tax=Pseudolysinimonas yzui TaxID=2708254 RepID=A0A8J3GQD5_9MICO|nr:polyprenol monophosphomannose synthase [Pseudolysinimonas yzui]GHF15286.1 dolichol-phosphate mannosyltransferase [Pseudolysinimonas yzui]